MSLPLGDMRLDRRRLRANSLAAAVMQVITPYIRDEDGQERKEAYYAMLKLFLTEGVEVLTDNDRLAAGLPPRDEKGWTPDELAVFEAVRLEALARPVYFRLDENVTKAR